MGDRGDWALLLCLSSFARLRPPGEFAGQGAAEQGSGASGYSYFRVSTGSSRAARLAGTVPKITPTMTEVASAIGVVEHEDVEVAVPVQLRHVGVGISKDREFL